MERTKYFRTDCGPEVFRYFSDRQWKMMNQRQRDRWTPFSEVELAAIPKEVIEFKKRHEPVDGYGAFIANDEVPGVIEVSEADQIKEQLKAMGVRFSPNSKLETLRKKLSDATNSEPEV